MKRAGRTLKTLVTGRLVLTFDRVDFVYERLSRRRRWNWLKTELSFLVRSDRAWAWPTHLQVEPTNVCNLQCPVCHVVTDDKPRGMLRFDDFTRLMDEVGDYLLFLHFWGWGEPFMNEDFFSMIRYARDRGIKIITSTNGHFFEKGDNIERLIDSGLEVLIMALDGVDRETYEKYRREGDFDKVVRGLKLFMKRREERGSLLPRLNLRMLVTRDNEDQVPAMRELARELGVDMLTLKTLCSFDDEERGSQLVPRNPEFRRFEYSADGSPLRIDNPCKKLWNHPTVYRDGVVVPCDYHTGREINLGSAFGDGQRGFGPVWFGEEFSELRSQFVRGERAGLRCDDCSLNFADVDRCVSHAFRLSAPE